ncbi:MAG: pectinesterase family protein, partial [Prevotella sp.]|nr:pectinesterase family protein [Prevotella sp.]
WKTDGLGKYYWQTMVNATSYTDLVVSSSMLLSYNAYSKYDVEYSIDSENWTQIGSFTLTERKQWYNDEFSLLSNADHQPNVYIRWIADTSSEIIGSSAENDGIAIAEIFILGTEDIIDDGVAPVLQSQVPEEGATNASANGRIVLTFDEKVMVAEDAVATIGNLEFTPTVSGKTVMVEYKGLEYSTTYTFTMPANTISDLSGNMITDAITITFSTKEKPEITKRLYDFIVPDDGTIQEAIAAAEARDDSSQRFYIFVKQGDYIIPASTTATKTSSVDGTTVYADPTTYVSKPNVSIIGEDRDLTTIANTVPSTITSDNKNVAEGLGQCETFYFQSNCANMYLQDITIKNSLADNTGRGAALEDAGDKTICKNVCLWGYQDTYYSRQSKRYYFEGGVLRGRTDFLCGRGDIFFNEVELIMCESGGYITAPSIPMKYGYIFRDCKITGSSSVNSKYYLGRPWGSGTPICLWINTTMEVQPYAAGWTDMSDGWPDRFAEYNSMTSSGSTVDLSNRKTSWSSHPSTTNDPILTASEAAMYTVETVMGGDDEWNPLDYTEQASIPTNVTLFGSTLSWDNSSYVLLWAVCKDGKVVGFTTNPQYTVDDATATYTVRGANEMGGLGEASAQAIVAGINGITTSDAEVVSSAYYNVNGVRVGASYKGIVIKVDTLKDGSKAVTKIINK